MTDYNATEERLNIITHGIGTAFALFASILLIVKGSFLSFLPWSSLWFYSFGLISVFASSTLYHYSKTAKKRFFFKKLDHTAIYYLIAGTYTPFLCLNIPTNKAHYLLIALWVIAGIGTLFKLLFAHKFQKISLIAYLLMGWFAVLIFDDMKQFLHPEALKFVIWGGVAYSVGAIFYALKKIPYTHAIWHVFVLLGAGLQFFGIYYYSVPFSYIT